jgi:hypothetical protein
LRLRLLGERDGFASGNRTPPTHGRMPRVRHLRASAPGATATRIRAREPWVLRARRGIGRKAPEVSVSAAVRVLVLKTPRPLFMGPTQPAEACLYICAVKDEADHVPARFRWQQDSSTESQAALAAAGGAKSVEGSGPLLRSQGTWTTVVTSATPSLVTSEA